MSNYVKATDFQAKDSLITGNPAKIIKGSEINDEFNAIQTSIATKADLASPAFTGNPTATTQTTGNNSTRVATTAFVQQEIDANAASVAITGGTIDGVAITGGTIADLTEPLAVADGGTGAVSITLNSVILGNNVDALSGNLVAPGTDGNVLTSDGTTWASSAPATIGVGQTWQNVKASRAEDTLYLNDTGKPIMVTVWFDDAGGSANIFVDTLAVAYLNLESGVGSSMSTIVPTGSTYSVESTMSAAALKGWVELR